MSINGLDPSSTRPGSYELSRIETIGKISYLMEEWTVLGPAKGNNSEASSSQFGQWVRNTAPEGVGQTDSSTALVIEFPVHSHNTRYIPLPEVSLGSIPLPYLGSRSTVALRVDFGENRHVREILILYEADHLAEELDLVSRVQADLELQYGSRKQHRVIVYMILDIDAGKVELRESLVVLPKCCF
jgi:hypothetical protein